MRVLKAWDSSNHEEITARISDDLETGRGGLIRFFGWLNDDPAIFLTRPGLDPDTFAVVPLSRLVLFITPGTRWELFTGDKPLSPALCAQACAEVCANLEWDLSPDHMNAVLDTVQDGIDRVIAMPPWSTTAEGQIPTRVAEVSAYVDGDLVDTHEVAL